MGDQIEPHRSVEQHPGWVIDEGKVSEVKRQAAASRVEEGTDAG